MQTKGYPFLSLIVRFNPGWPCSLAERDNKKYAYIYIYEHVENKGGGGAIMMRIHETQVLIKI